MAIIDDEREKWEIISKIFQKIINDFGKDILLDVNRVNAILMDYIPKLEEERKLLVIILKEKIHFSLQNMKKNDLEYQKYVFQKMVKDIQNSLCITESIAINITQTLFVGLGIEEGDKLYNKKLEKNSSKILKKGEIEEKSLKEIQIEKYVEIGYKAFSSNISITELEIPNNIKRIQSKAFLNCIYLENISLPSSIEYIGKYAFEGCLSLRKINIKNNKFYTVVDEMLIDKIKKTLLKVCVLVENYQCKIPNGIQKICEKSFDRMNITHVFIPSTVSIIEKRAFYLTMQLECCEVHLQNPRFSSVDGILHTRRKERLLFYPQGKKEKHYILEDEVETIENRAFSMAQYLELITFNRKIERIENRAFEYCKNLKSLILPMSIKNIGERAFQYCENLITVLLPKNLCEISDYTFYNCQKLLEITIPKSVTRIGHMAFANCTSLEKIIIQDRISSIGDGAFLQCYNLTIYIKDNLFVKEYCKAQNIRYITM